MRVLTWIYALLALALCTWLALTWRDAARAEPRTMLEAARRSISGPLVDSKRGMRELAAALDAAEKAEDLPLVEEILVTRARLLKSSGGLTQARADIERVLTHLRPNSPGLEALLAAIDLEAGDIDSALARANAVLVKDRNQTEAWGVKAEALLALAEQNVQNARRRAGLSLAEAGLDAADLLMRRIAAREPTDPDRARSIDELYAAFPASEKHRAREVLQDLDEAGRLLAEVPMALAESFRGPVRRDTAQAYLQVLRDAGETELAVDFGLGVSRLSALSTYPAFLRQLMRTLVDAGRLKAAAEIVDPALGKKAGPDADFFQDWAETLYRAESWPVLPHAANLLRAAGDPDQRSISNFYLGLGQARLGVREQAQIALDRYLHRGTVEPFPGATVVAWQTLSEVERALNKSDAELGALRRRLTLAPDSGPHVADAWLRRAEIAAATSGADPLNTLEYLAQALRLAPLRNAELEPRWRELGRALAEAQHIDIAAECRTLEERGISFPEGQRTSYELVAITAKLLERGNTSTAALVARRTLEAYPDFLPALDMAADAEAALGDFAAAALHYRRRLEIGGPDLATVEALIALPLDELGPQWSLDLVRLDPEGFGRRLAAQRLQERGAIGDAIAGLQRVAPERLGDDGLLTLAQLLFDQGHEVRAQAELAKLSGAIDVLSRALPLMIDIGVRERDTKHISALIRLLQSRAPVDDTRLLASVDHMLSAGLVESARELVQAMDSRSRYRSAPLYVRLAQVELLSGNFDAAVEALDRALPYDDSGASELGFVIVAVERRRWSELPKLARAVEASALEATPLQYVALAALGERLTEARFAAQRAREDLPDEPLWPLIDAALAVLEGRAPQGDGDAQAFGVRADGAVERDPRPLLARLAALAHAEWNAWAIADCERQAPPAPGALWPTYLAALGNYQAERDREAEELARALLATWPRFAPAWDLIEQSIEAAVRKPDHPRLVRLAEQRRAALGDEALRGADAAVFEARAREAAGDLDGALAALERALELEPTRQAALRRKAQILRKRSDWNAAIDAFERSLLKVRDETDSHPVAEFVELLEEAYRADPVALERTTRAALDALSARLPDDPALTLAIARRLLPARARGSRVETGAALNLLQEFRRRTAGVALDDLRDGSAVAWADFLSSIDTAQAYEHVRAELTLSPASVELWRKLAEVAQQIGEFDEAIEAAQTASRMLPDPDTARLLARLYSQRGDDIERVRAQVAEAARVSGTTPDERPLALALARALVHAERARLPEGLTLLQGLWETRDAELRPEEFVEIGSLYGLALCRRAEPADRNTASNVLKEVAPLVADPLRRSVLVAMASMSRYLGL